MKLAMITPDALGHCLICRWQCKAPLKKRNRRTKEERELTPKEQQAFLEKEILAHLHSTHDRVLLTKEELAPGEGELLVKVYYHGRFPSKELR